MENQRVAPNAQTFGAAVGACHVLRLGFEVPDFVFRSQGSSAVKMPRPAIVDAELQNQVGLDERV